MVVDGEDVRGIRQRIRKATAGFVGREALAELMILAAVAREHVLVIGPPGTAKSSVVRNVARCLGGRYFEYLLGRFTEPSELFGPVDLQKLKEGRIETNVSGMLPEADIVFLDEVFLGSTAILNTLLGVLNERRFRRGRTEVWCPLKVCVGAANSLPEDPALAAFADRFLLHLFIEPVADHQLDDMLAGGWALETLPQDEAPQGEILERLSARVAEVDMSAARPLLVVAIRALRQAGIALSDRRIVRSQKLIAAAAVLRGHTQASSADLWPLLYALPTEAWQQQGQDALRAVLGEAFSTTLLGSVEQASQQPLSRCQRLLERAAECGASSSEVESVLREIDANFSAATLPVDLAEARQSLLARLTSLTP